MAQPGERLLLQLPHSFTAKTQLFPQLLQRARGLLSQAVPTYDHLVKMAGELVDQVVQGIQAQFPVQFRRRVRHDPRCGHLLYRNIAVSAQFLGPAMNVAVDGYPSVSGKGCPPPRVIALERVP